MGDSIFCTAGDSKSLSFAIQRLKAFGFEFTSLSDPRATHLLLPVPSLDAEGNIRGGGKLQEVMPPDICVIGGNLPALPKAMDLMQDPAYVAENAYITAHCAVRMLMEKLPTALRGCPILVIGWGRIGKCLAALLKGLEATVTVAARKESDRAILRALGYQSTEITDIQAENYRVIFNTAPAMLLPDIPGQCIKIDLASSPGLGGPDVIHARGLPGKDAPEASGELIARTILRLIRKEKEV